MDIIEFFQQSAGKWFCQRTVHNLNSAELKAGKFELNIDILPPEDATVVKLCQKYQTDPAQASLAGARVTSKGETAATVLVAIADSDNPQEGKLLQERGDGGAGSFVGRYAIAPDDVLTLVTESDTVYAEERLWYLMPNLRLRTSFVKQANGLSMACFYSEIRRLS
ncbi:MAG: phycobiliprotein lyase [Cyanobacteriota bacterium]|nr:phycobiliprotein lyase [Cyanobacteriota bacterium]